VSPRSRDPEKAAIQAANLIKGQASDPEVAERQRAALQPNARVTHGAYSAARREPLEQQHRERLRLAYGAAPDDLINAAATRAAIVSLLAAFVNDAGVVFARGKIAEVSAPARELRLALRDHEQAIRHLEEHERLHGADAAPDLDSYLQQKRAALAAGETEQEHEL
jgi:hypothetical protein